MNHLDKLRNTAALPAARIALAVAGLLSLGAVSAPARGGSQDDDGPRVQDTRSVVSEWIETRRHIERARGEWAVGRELLQGRVDAVQREIDSLRDVIRDTEEQIGNTSGELTAHVARNEELLATSAAIEALVIALEIRTSALLPRLPEPLRKEVLPFSQRIPEDPRDPAHEKLGLARRLQSIIGILNAVNKFNRAVSVHSEVRAMDDGTSVEVTSLYVGIGQGYYVATHGKAAGIGVATSDGWAWTDATDAAEQIKLAIDIYNNEEPASFVRLPVRLELGR